MRIDNSRESRNVDDRRFSGGSRGGRLPSLQTIMFFWPFIRMLLRSKLGIAALVVGSFLWYGNGFGLLSGGVDSTTEVSDSSDEHRVSFIKKVLANTEDVWKSTLPQYGIEYKEPGLILYRGNTRSACGHASAQMGPFYCPVDQKIYLDLSFFDELAKRYGEPGDFAQAYVLAHEIGHHIQNIQGTLDKVQRIKQNFRSKTRENALQVMVELQADCYAGVWGNKAQKNYKILEQGDAEEAINAASAIGDDKLQRESTGYVRPDSFTHGTSAQRVKWFKIGFMSGDLRKCNTFK